MPLAPLDDDTYNRRGAVQRHPLGCKCEAWEVHKFCNQAVSEANRYSLLIHIGRAAGVPGHETPLAGPGRLEMDEMTDFSGHCPSMMICSYGTTRPQESIYCHGMPGWRPLMSSGCRQSWPDHLLSFILVPGSTMCCKVKHMKFICYITKGLSHTCVSLRSCPPTSVNSDFSFLPLTAIFPHQAMRALKSWS